MFRPSTTPTVVTYRHLLSPGALTVFNPLRTIAHCDIDAAYAQFEQIRLGLADEIPLICAQWQSIIAVNYPARKYGIKRFNTIDEAKKMCPDLYVQHVATYRNGEAEPGYWDDPDPRTHKVSLDVYRRESLKILAIFKEMIPKGEIEKASIDEAFFDLSATIVDRLLEMHPFLANVPTDSPDGFDTPLPPAPSIDWEKAGNVVPINSSATVGEGSKPKEDMVLDAGEGNHQDTWEDWALYAGALVMAEVRAEIYKKLHYTCSAGIAHSKAMAKLCSAWKKPNNQTVLRQAATPGFLKDMDFTDIRMLGGKLGTSIATEFDAKTVGDLLTVSLEDMQKRFGDESIWVYNIIRGIDHSEVTSRVSTKSMLASKNTRPPVTTPEQGTHWLKILSGELFVRLREAREVTPGIWPKTLVLGTRTGIDASRHRQIPFPVTRNLDAEYIFKFAKKVWEEVCQPMSRGGMKLNNMSLAFNGLEKMEEGQRGIEGFFAGRTHVDVKPLSTGTSDPDVDLKRKHSLSESSAPEAQQAKKTRLPTLHTGKKRNALEGFLTTGPRKNGESSKSIIESARPAASAAPVSVDESEDDLNEIIEYDPIAHRPDSSWICPTCGKTLSVGEDVPEDARSASLEDIKREHEDYHFALKLQNGSSPFSKKETTKNKRSDQKESAKTKSGSGKKNGIQAFFTPKEVKKK